MGKVPATITVRGFRELVNKSSFGKTQKRRHSNRGFTLVEVVLSVGIIGFAFLSLLGMTAVGVTTFKKSMDNDVGSQIVQRIVDDAQQTGYATLISTPTSMRYFDEQGNELTSIASSVYTAQVTVSGTTQLPSTSTPASANLATITVKLANNPTRNPSPFSSSSNVPYTVHSALIAKSQ